MDLLLGVGAGAADSVLGIGAHNLLVTYVVEFGLVSTALFVVLWALLLNEAPRRTPLLLAFLINGFSFTTPAVPYFYASLFLIGGLSRAAPAARARPSRGALP